MKKAIYPGSFDPVTLGHLDVIERSAKLVDELIVAVLNNKSKSPLFNVQNRVKMLRDVVSGIPNVVVVSFDGLLVDFAKKMDAKLIIRGLRAVTDFEYELQMSQTNRVLDNDIETIFLCTALKYSYLNSSTVREIAHHGGDISKFVPKQVLETVTKKMEELKENIK